MRTSHFLLPGLVLASIGAAGCSSSPAQTTDYTLKGEYKATSAGNISSINFTDATHYSMTKTGKGCANGASSCVEMGTYTRSGETALNQQVTITFTDSSGKVTSFPFTPTNAASPSATNSLTGMAHTLGVTLTADAGSLGSGGSAASLIAMLVALIEGFLMAEQAFSSGSDSGAPTTVNPGLDAGFATFDGGFDSGFDAEEGSTPQAIPITMITGMDGKPRATVQVSVGGGAPFTAILDTGSVGLRVAPGVVPDSAWTVTTTNSNVTFGGDLSVTGLIASASVQVGSVSTNGPIPVVKVTSTACVAGHPTCSAAGQDAGSFRFGDQFGAILGVGMRVESSGLVSPFAEMGDSQQYFMRIPAPGATSGIVEIDPTATEVASLATEMTLTGNGQTTPDGIPGWDDTQVPFCLNDFCATGILDTGSASISLNGLQTNDYASVGAAANATSVPSGVAVVVTLNQNAEQWSFTVGNPPQLGVDSILLSATAAPDSLGLAPFRQFDVFYDYWQGMLGLEGKATQQ